MPRVRRNGEVEQQRSAIVYCRVSSKIQEEEGTSLQSQADAGVKHAAQLGYSVGRITKEVYTGTELWDRPLLSRDRADLKAGTFHALIAYSTDRLSRDPIHLAIVAEECERAGAELIFVTEPLDTSPEAALIRYVKGYAAKLEHAKIRERTLRGKRTRAESGKLPNAGADLYGYIKNRALGTRSIHEPEAAVVRQIFHWVAVERIPMRDVLRRLNTSGTPSPSVRKFSFSDPGRVPRWGQGAISRLLRDPAYKGEAYAWRWMGGGRRGNGHVVNPVVRDKSEWIPMPAGNTPALVSAQQWQDAQDRLDTNRGEATRNETRPYLLRGFIRCSVCGRRMRASPEHGGVRTYRCASRETPAGACGGARVPAEFIEAAVWQEVDRRLRDPALIETEAAAARSRGADASAATELLSTRRSLTRLDQQQERLVARYRTSDDATFPWELIEREVARVEREKSELRATIGRLEARATSQAAVAAKVEQLSAYCARVSRKLDRFSFDEKRFAFDAIGLQVHASGRDWRVEGDLFPLSSGI
jgi:site-specific DNA recombinase